MKNHIIVLFSLFVTLSLFAEEKVLTVNLDKSSIEWSAKKVTGEHHGTLALKSGTVLLQENSFKKGRFELDMNSIINLDIKDEGMNKRLIDHLKSKDFFSVEKFPIGVFEIDTVTPGESENRFNIDGKLTLKGITQKVSFIAEITNNNGTFNANAVIVLDRTLWDIRFRSGKFFSDLGDKLIHDDFTVKLDLVLSEK